MYILSSKSLKETRSHMLNHHPDVEQKAEYIFLFLNNMFVIL